MNKLFTKPEIDIYDLTVVDVVCTSAEPWKEDGQEIGNENDNDWDFS